jgi:hypothetical protein
MATASPLPGEFLQKVTLDKLPGWDSVFIQGYTPSIDTVNVPCDLRPQNTTYVFPTAAVDLQVVSNNANDSGNGTGARTIRIEGLDTDYEVISDVITLNGITPVAVPKPYLRVNFTTVLTSGTLNANAGAIVVRTVVGGNILSTIPLSGVSTGIGMGVGTTAVYTVPKGSRIFLLQAAGYIVNSNMGSVEIMLRVREFGPDKPFVVRALMGMNIQGSSFSPYKAEISRPYPAKSDVKITVASVTDTPFSVYALALFYKGPEA